MKLFLRIETAVGPRVIISQGHDSEVAHAIKQAIEAACPGNYAEVTMDGAIVPMKELMRRRQMARLRQAKKDAAATNVTLISAARKAKP